MKSLHFIDENEVIKQPPIREKVDKPESNEANTKQSQFGSFVLIRPNSLSLLLTAEKMWRNHARNIHLLDRYEKKIVERSW